MPTKTPNPIDQQVGSRVRMRRLIVGMSQEKLGTSLGITFQQIQKYEKGTNRIGASRLQQMAGVLGVPVSFFFESSEVPASAAAATGEVNVADFLATSEGLRIVKAFGQVKAPIVRRRIVELIEAISANIQETQPAPLRLVG